MSQFSVGGWQGDEIPMERLVDEIQSTLGIVGHVSVVGGSLTWSPAAPGTESRKLVITITPQSGKTHIHIEERFEMSGWRIIAGLNSAPLN